MMKNSNAADKHTTGIVIINRSSPPAISTNSSKRSTGCAGAVTRAVSARPITSPLRTHRSAIAVEHHRVLHTERKNW